MEDFNMMDFNQFLKQSLQSGLQRRTMEKEELKKQQELIRQQKLQRQQEKGKSLWGNVLGSAGAVGGFFIGGPSLAYTGWQAGQSLGQGLSENMERSTYTPNDGQSLEDHLTNFRGR